MSRITKAVIFIMFFLAIVGFSSVEAITADEIIEATGVKGGLVVHLGCGDGKLTAKLHRNDSYIVHGLDASSSNVSRARKYVQSLGIYGRVSVARLSGKTLPYAENMVNLVVAQKLFGIEENELMRVLVPGGTVYIKQGEKWRKIKKPRPDDIDEWSHYTHDVSGNMVAKDTVVGPPRRLKWKAGPEWMRHHDLVPPCAMVSGGGRIFYIKSEGPIEAQSAELAGHRWFLFARDAFNGVLLWKRPMPNWGWHQWSTKWLQRYNIPYQLGRRLTVFGDKLYVTLGYNAPLSELDAATGKVIRTFDEAGFVDEILCLDDKLILSVYNKIEKPKYKGVVVKKDVCAVSRQSGKVLWKKGAFSGVKSHLRFIDPFTRLGLCIANERIFLVDNDHLVALGLQNGEELWRIPRPDKDKYLIPKVGNDMCRLVATDDVLLFAQLDPVNSNVWHTIPGCIYAFNAKDGKLLWRDDKFGSAAYHSLPGVFVIDTLVWYHEHLWPDGIIGKKSRWVHQEDYDFKVFGAELKTGEIKKTYNTEKIFNVGHHHRCHRNVATQRFLLTARRGVELIDVADGKIEVNNWVRGTCLLGYMPCNGLLYTPQHPCQCYLNAKINGLNALAALPSDDSDRGNIALEARLDKGPAYNTVSECKDTNSTDEEDWPTYRGDGSRSGSNKTKVPFKLTEAWDVKLDGTLSAPVVSGGRLYVAAVDSHTVFALDTQDGSEVWRYVADGKVDSPPTIYKGIVFFGTRNGLVYALRQKDGVLVWRFLAAPKNRLIGAYGLLESAWPVYGSVLVHQGKLYCAAGRNTYLDDGICAYELDPASGRVLRYTRFCDLDPETGESPKTDDEKMPGARNDVLVGCGDSVYMRQLELFGNRQEQGKWVEGKARKKNEPVNPYDSKRRRSIKYEGPKPDIRIIASNGFLDDAYFDRTAMSVGTTYGQLVVYREDTAFGLQAYPSASRGSEFHPGSGYRLFSSKIEAPDRPWSYWSYESIGRGRFDTLWSEKIPVRGHSMVLTGDVLFICGPPDVMVPQDPYAAYEGRKGSILAAFSVEDGKKLAEYKLDYVPVFDSLIAAHKALFLTTKDGKVRCLR